MPNPGFSNRILYCCEKVSIIHLNCGLEVVMDLLTFAATKMVIIYPYCSIKLVGCMVLSSSPVQKGGVKSQIQVI